MPRAADYVMAALSGGRQGGDAAADTLNNTGLSGSFMGGDWNVSTKAPDAIAQVARYIPIIVGVAGLVALAWVMRRARQ